MRKIWLAGVVSFATLVSQAQARDALLGKWKVTVSPAGDAAGSAKEYTDSVTIKGGKFESDALKKQGFDAAAYDDKSGPLGVAAEFSCTMTNKDGDTAKWTGTSVSGKITGQLVVTKKDGTAANYSFEAEKA